MIRTKSTPDTVRVTFAVPQDVGPVSVVGCFNGWDPLATPMQRRSNGTRSAVVTVPPGTTMRFRYLGDGGRWMTDETAPVDADDNVIVV